MHLVLTRQTTVRSALFVLHSEGCCSSRQMCSHVEVITYLLAVFILSHTDWIITYSSFVQRHQLYYANAYCNGFSPTDQILLL